MSTVMYRDQFHGVMSWIAGGAASVALALFCFVPTIAAVENETLRTAAMCCFVFSMPFLVMLSIAIKDIKLKNESTPKSDKALGIYLFLGCIPLLIGILALCFSISHIYGLTFLLATSVVSIVHKVVS